MKNLRKPLFVGIAVLFVTLTPNVQASEAEKIESVIELEIADIEEINQRTEDLENRMARLLASSEEKIEKYTIIYKSIQEKEARLERERIEKEKQQAKAAVVVSNVSQPQVPQQRGPSISLDLRTPAGITGQDINQHVLNGTALQGLGPAFVKAEQDYGVNALFLLSLGIHESGWGRSAIARDKNNLFGFGAYDGSAYQSAIHFPSKEAGIDRVAKHLSETYLRVDGRYYGGGFTLSNVNRRYASDTQWASKIAATMDKINRDIINK